MNFEVYPANENLRLAALSEYDIVHTEADSDYDELTFLAAEICDVPIAQISIIDKNNIWFKSIYGSDLKEIPRKDSLCQLSVLQQKKHLIVSKEEALEEFEEANRHYKKNLQFYAGIPLLNKGGHAIAVFCILDTVPRVLTPFQERALHALANQAMNLLEFRKQKNRLYKVQNKLKSKYKELERFTSVVSHDIKSPLANIISLAELLKDENQGKFDEDTEKYLQFLVESSYSLRNYVDGILSYYRSDHIIRRDLEEVSLEELLKKVADLYQVSDDVEISYPENVLLHRVNKAALTQVFMNLISNALKYNEKDQRKIEIGFRETELFYCFTVADNGNGISDENLHKIFDLFTTLDANDRDGNPGSGIGLATVKKLVENMDGEINVTSHPGHGSTFQFKIKRL
ncbi:HAMP domain-containing sensor histidine kinase [Zunongwangia sp. F363]|uniref:histidine kinase n=1 Tax=Autumnicola tepida TaxID=3075595 RepID=A0ABU3CCH0_9FLAO|nr:HAMP domain-containing sensor histidine kinase [Zunongwangia sp. F363]MDT0644046.1 HAMP domain-containing sensor histidine kinase [Zunongwangia sp. F363]